MTDARKEVATSYGEGDIEAKAMGDAAAAPEVGAPEVGAPEVGAPAPPPEAFVPASGTSETDVTENLRQKAERESKS